MKSIEIRNTTWKTFCEEFTRLHQGSLITIEMLDANGEKTLIAQDIPLDRIKLDKSNDCNDLIVISASEPGRRRVDHIAVEPIYVTIREDTEHPKLLQITAENGTTLITYHSGQLDINNPSPVEEERCVL